MTSVAMNGTCGDKLRRNQRQGKSGILRQNEGESRLQEMKCRPVVIRYERDIWRLETKSRISSATFKVERLVSRKHTLFSEAEITKTLCCVVHVWSDVENVRNLRTTVSSGAT